MWLSNGYQESLTCYEQALDLDEREERALLGRCIALEALGRPNEALTCVNHLLELNPFNNLAADLKIILLRSRSIDGQEKEVHRLPNDAGTTDLVERAAATGHVDALRMLKSLPPRRPL